MADTLDSYVNAFPFARNISPNTFYAANASVRYDANQVSSKSSVLGDPFDNSNLYDEDPASRALRLARDGTSRQWACNSASPFQAPFAKIDRQRQIEREYYWAGCIPPTIFLSVFFIILYLAVSVGAIAYYINNLTNPCTAIVYGALIEWDHSSPLITNRMAALPIAPVLPPPAFATASTAPPILATSQTTTVDVAPNPIALFVSNLFGNNAGLSTTKLESRSIYSGVSAASCDVLSAPSLQQVCAGQWSIPSAEWIAVDPEASKFVFRGCGAKCVGVGNGGVCTCPIPPELKR